jgi:H+/Cl- antiporter ClcA
VRSNFLRLARLLKRTRYSIWLGRAVIWITTAAATYVLMLFNRLVDVSISGFESAYAAHSWLPWLLAPFGGMLIVFCVVRFCEGAEGSGIPQVIVAQQTNGPLDKLTTLRIAIGKMLLGAAALGCGFSAGREGPSVQIAASMMAAAKRFIPDNFPVRRDELLLAGGAVGIAAAFNTPVAGVMFAIEELGQRFHSRTNGVLLTAIIFAGIISIYLQGNYNYFGHLRVPDSSEHLFVPTLLMGLCGGLFGGLFSRLILLGTGPWPGAAGRFKKNHPVLFAGACGLLVAAIGVYSHGTTFGSGYLNTQAALHQAGHSLPGNFSALKFLATLISYIAGIPGGIFAPSLSIGAGFGQSLASLHIADLSTIAWMVLGMTAFMAGVTQAPMTSFIIVMEMTDGHPMVIGMIAAAVLASVISRTICQPLYHALAHRMIHTRRLAEQQKLAEQADSAQ